MVKKIVTTGLLISVAIFAYIGLIHTEPINWGILTIIWAGAIIVAPTAVIWLAAFIMAIPIGFLAAVTTPKLGIDTITPLFTWDDEKSK